VLQADLWRTHTVVHIDVCIWVIAIAIQAPYCCANVRYIEIDSNVIKLLLRRLMLRRRRPYVM